MDFIGKSNPHIQLDSINILAMIFMYRNSMLEQHCFDEFALSLKLRLDLHFVIRKP